MGRKVAVVQRVLPEYRREFFLELSRKYKLKVFHSEGLCEGTYVNAKDTTNFGGTVLFSFSKLFRLKNKEIFVSFMPTLFFKLYEQKPHVIVTEGATNLPNNFVVFLYSLIFTVPVVWWDVGRDVENGTSRLRVIFAPFLRWFIRKSSIIAAYNNKSAAYFESIKDANKVKNIMNSTSVMQNIERCKTSKYFNVIYIGAVEKRKGLACLVEAVSGSKYLNSACNITFVGDGDYMQELQSYCKETKLKNYVFKGAVRAVEDKAELFSESMVMVLPGWSTLAIVEAMAYGVPTIAANYGGPEYDYIESTFTGYVIERCDVDMIRRHLHDLVENDNLLDAMSSNCKKYYAENFSVKNMADNMSEAIELSFYS